MQRLAGVLVVVSLAFAAHAAPVVEFELDPTVDAGEGEQVLDLAPSEDPNAAEFQAPGVVRSTPPAVKPAPAKAVWPKPAPPREIPLIETQNEGTSEEDVTFVTGGVGEDEKEAIEAAKGDYNLHVINSSVDGAYVGDVRVVIHTAGKGNVHEKLNIVAGPLLYVRLPAGSYVLKATLGAQVKQQNFTVTKRGKSVYLPLGWKAAAH